MSKAVLRALEAQIRERDIPLIAGSSHMILWLFIGMVVGLSIITN